MSLRRIAGTVMGMLPDNPQDATQVLKIALELVEMELHAVAKPIAPVIALVPKPVN